MFCFLIVDVSWISVQIIEELALFLCMWYVFDFLSLILVFCFSFIPSWKRIWLNFSNVLSCAFSRIWKGKQFTILYLPWNVLPLSTYVSSSFDFLLTVWCYCLFSSAVGEFTVWLWRLTSKILYGFFQIT